MRTREIDPVLQPRDAETGEPLEAREQPGYYQGFSTMAQKAYWEPATRELVEKRFNHPPARRFFTEAEFSFWTAVFDHLLPQYDRVPEKQIPLVAVLDERLAQNKTVGYRYESMPHDREVYRLGIDAIDAEATARFGGEFRTLSWRQQDEVLDAIQQGKVAGAKAIWQKMNVERFWQMIMTDAIDAYYAHPLAWDEIGFGGPAYPRAYTRLERGEPEPWEREETRYEWLAPVVAVSDKTEAPGEDESTSHHGSGGTH